MQKINSTVLLALDNYFPITSNDMPLHAFNQGCFALKQLVFPKNRHYECEVKIMSINTNNRIRFRYEFKNLVNKEFKVIARVERRGCKDFIKYNGEQVKVATMLLKNVSCYINDEELAFTDHTWISGEISKIVYDYNIQPGDHIEFYAVVSSYKYSFGMKQLGLVQVGKQYRIFK